jgi:catechol 2,3-dioxygenase-like lactoylglutathione lyase family enzyme
MKFCNVRLLVKDYRKVFNFYTQTLGFEAAFDVGDCYASFKILKDSDSEGLAIFLSDYFAPVVGNADKSQPTGCREKSEVGFEVECVDSTYETLKAKGVEFINMPFDWKEAGIRIVYLYDPEGNLLSFYTMLETECAGKKHTGTNFGGVTTLVEDHKKCVEFYAEKLGFPINYNEAGYASFDVSAPIEFSLMESHYQAATLGNANKPMPTNCREKSLISFYTENVDETYKALLAKGVIFVNKPIDMPDWGMRVVHLRDPEENLIELYTPLATE